MVSIVAESKIDGRIFFPSFLLSVSVFTFFLLLSSLSQSIILMKNTDDYINSAMDIISDSFDGKLIDSKKNCLYEMIGGFILIESFIIKQKNILLFDHVFTLILVGID